ncbi:TIGR04028 family ABC transporter substrate-binding protein [Corynebacterium poyangense]|uniref:TIGR04028 family ABC transporter substrate-binding protein n=2 Tax=Corynebacterium poyangense TaxID=2684405 RepID=A0A7H0SSH3_9CORY|nr:TIGR04028 family ABC transporter substrate-binding protein [Corynebacterium poyangense]QNQ91498.1 TIGR04028 family ABC transporter substrate-binding protein [Corynebacterium poyangense]
MMLCVLCLLTGCGYGGHLGQPAAKSASDLNKQELTYLEPQFFNSLYPPSAGFYPNGAVINNICDRLLYQDPDTLELHPWIAKELPEVNEDATEYTFRLRPGVSYSDGTPVDAENVLRNIELYAKGDKSRHLTSSEQISNYRGGEVIDPLTVKFHFSAPAPGFAQATSSYNAGLVANSTLDGSDTDFAPGSATKVIGSGPFVISEEDLGSRLVLTARKDYRWAPSVLAHQGPAYLEKINYILASEQSVRIGGLVAGQADIARQIEAPEEKHLKDSGLEILAHGTNGVTNQLAFRFRHPLLQDIRVRQALMHGIDREEIIHTLYSDSYPLATSSLATTASGYKAQPADAFAYDPELSSALLNQAGWEPGPDGIRQRDGRRLSFTVNEALPQPRSKELITKAQEHLRRIGVELKLNPGDQTTQNADSKDLGKIEIRHTMVGRADNDVIKSQYGTAERNTFLNKASDVDAIDPHTGLNPAEVAPPDQHLQDLLEKVTATVDPSQRNQISGEIQDYLTSQAYVLPLFEEPVVYGYQPYVHGFHAEAIGRPSFYDVWLGAPDETQPPANTTKENS